MIIQAYLPRRIVRRALPRRPGAHPLFTGGLEAFLDDFWRDFDDVPATRDGAFEPRVDVSETDSELHLAVELPGLEGEDFEVTVDDGVIAIHGEKKLPGDGDAKGRVHAERSGGGFSRSFRIPFEVDPEAVTGSYRNGVLTVSVPKPADPEPRTIPITTA